MGQIDARNLDICKDPFFQPDPCSGIRRYQMKRRPFLVLAIVLVVVSAFAQPKVNANKILKGDKLGQQLVTAVEKENNSNTSELLAKQPTILSRTIALEIALNRNFTNTSNLILASGIAKDKDPDGMTALMYAAKHGLTSAIRELVRNGATIDQRMSVRYEADLSDRRGNNALSLAILNRRSDSARVLLELGASVFIGVYLRGAGIVYAGRSSDPMMYRNASDYVEQEAQKASILELAEMSKDPILISLVKAASLKNLGNPRYIIGSSDINHVALSANNKLMATWGNVSKEVKIWALPEGTLLKTIPDQQRHTYLAFSPDSTSIALLDESGVTLIDISSGVVIKRIPGARKDIIASGEIAFSSDGKLLTYILPLYDNRNLEIWSIDDNAQKQEMLPAVPITDAYDHVAFGNEYIAASHYIYKKPFQIDVWRLSGKRAIATIINDVDEYLSQLWFGDDGDLYGLTFTGTVSGTRSNLTLKVWSIPQGSLRSAKTFQFEKLKIRTVGLSSNTKYGIVNYVSYGKTGTTFCLFSLPDLKLIRTFSDWDFFEEEAIGSDGSTFIGYNTFSVKQWDLKSLVSDEK